MLGDDVFPFLLSLRPAVGQDNATRLVLDGLEQHRDLVAGLRRDDLVHTLVVPLAQLDGAFALVADVHPDLVADDVEDAAGDDLVGLEFLFLRG